MSILCQNIPELSEIMNIIQIGHWIFVLPVLFIQWDESQGDASSVFDIISEGSLINFGALLPNYKKSPTLQNWTSKH